MVDFITWIFGICVYILQVIGGSPGDFGFGYYLAKYCYIRHHPARF